MTSMSPDVHIGTLGDGGFDALRSSGLCQLKRIHLLWVRRGHGDHGGSKGHSDEESPYQSVSSTLLRHTTSPRCLYAIHCCPIVFPTRGWVKRALGPAGQAPLLVASNLELFVSEYRFFLTSSI